MTATDGRTARAVVQRRERRAAILDAALTSFSTRGYHGTRVSDILTEAGIARGTFYLYFDSKVAIFRELLDTLLTNLRERVVGVDTTSGAPPVAMQLLETVRRVFETMTDNRALTAILIREAVGVDAEVDVRLDAFYESLRTMLAESLARGQALGLVRDDMDLEIVSTCILGSVRQILARELRSADAALDVDRVARAVLDYNARGLMR